MNAYQFNTKFSDKVKTERKITNEILRDILFAEDRKFHLELGFSSLFDWLTKGHGYSGSSAQRRIQAARLLKSVPMISEKLESGATNLTTIAMAQSVFMAKEKLGEKLSHQDKVQVIEQLEQKSTFEVEQKLMHLFPEMALAAQPDKKTVVSEERTRLTCDCSNETLAILERVKELLSHTCPEGSMNDILNHLGNYFLKREDPLSKKSTTVAVNPRVKNVSRPVRRLTFQKADGRCEYKDPQTGRVCGTRIRIETDHIRMRAMGGGHEAANLRCLCREHNQFMAKKLLSEDIARIARN